MLMLGKGKKNSKSASVSTIPESNLTPTSSQAQIQNPAPPPSQEPAPAPISNPLKALEKAIAKDVRIEFEKQKQSYEEKALAGDAVAQFKMAKIYCSFLSDHRMCIEIYKPYKLSFGFFQEWTYNASDHNCLTDIGKKEVKQCFDWLDLTISKGDKRALDLLSDKLLRIMKTPEREQKMDEWQRQKAQLYLQRMEEQKEKELHQLEDKNKHAQRPCMVM